MARAEEQHPESRSDELTPATFRQTAEDHHPGNGHERQQQVLEPQQQKYVAGRPSQHEHTDHLNGKDADRQPDLGNQASLHELSSTSTGTHPRGRIAYAASSVRLPPVWITTETSRVFDMRATHVKHTGDQDLPGIRGGMNVTTAGRAPGA